MSTYFQTTAGFFFFCIYKDGCHNTRLNILAEIFHLTSSLSVNPTSIYSSHYKTRHGLQCHSRLAIPLTSSISGTSSARTSNNKVWMVSPGAKVTLPETTCRSPVASCPVMVATHWTVTVPRVPEFRIIGRFTSTELNSGSSTVSLVIWKSEGKTELSDFQIQGETHSRLTTQVPPCTGLLP